MVVDKCDRPLGAMSAKEAIAQNLYRRLIAVLAVDLEGRWLMRWREERGFGYTCQDLLPWDSSREDFAVFLVQSTLETVGMIALSGSIAPSGGQNIFATVYEAAIPRHRADYLSLRQDIIAAGFWEIPFLKDRGYLFDPLLLAMAEKTASIQKRV